MSALAFGGHTNAPQFTDLGSVFQSMYIQQPSDNKFYMDSRASSHFSFNQGNILSLTTCRFLPNPKVLAREDDQKINDGQKKLE